MIKFVCSCFNWKKKEKKVYWFNYPIEIIEDCFLPSCYEEVVTIRSSLLVMSRHKFPDPYIHKVACILEAQDKIPIDVWEYLRRKNVQYWTSILKEKTISNYQKNIIAVHYLLTKGAKEANMRLFDYTNKWTDPLLYLCGQQRFKLFNRAARLFRHVSFRSPLELPLA